jgi:hypothetical protein
MSELEIIYSSVILGVLFITNLAYKKFPRNYEKLYDMLTEEK